MLLSKVIKRRIQMKKLLVLGLVVVGGLILADVNASSLLTDSFLQVLPYEHHGSPNEYL